MLEEVLMRLNNWFLVRGGIYEGTYEVKSGGIALPFLKNGQYFRIIGSLFNDGLHKYPSDDLTDETFDGVIWALEVPPQVIKIAEDISEWQAKQGGPSAYTSESFGGYSYTKATGSDGMPAGWESVFQSRLSPWKKARDVSYVQPSKRSHVFVRPWNPDYPFGGDF